MTSFCDLNLKVPFILAVSVCMSTLKIRFSRVEHEKSFITSGPGMAKTNVLLAG